MTHTPGPWRNEDLVISATRPDGKVVHPARVYFYEDIDRAEAEANANLIAAVPELLAVVEAVEWIETIVLVRPYPNAPEEQRTTKLCPWCTGLNRHTTDCPRQLALAKARGRA